MSETKELFKIAKIEKVSYDVYKECMQRYYPTYDFDTNEENNLRKDYNNIKIPKRLNHNEAGYNFKAPFNFKMYPGTHIYIPSGISVETDSNWMIGSPNTQHDIQLSIIVEPIESTGTTEDEITTTNSSITSDNLVSRGHIIFHLTLPDNKPGLFLTSMTRFGKDLRILYDPFVYEAGDVFASVIFMPYGIVTNDIPESDNVHLVLKPMSNFTWSAISYPGSTDPKLDGKTVIVTIDSDGYSVTYSFEEVIMPEIPDEEETPDEQIPDEGTGENPDDSEVLEDPEVPDVTDPESPEDPDITDTDVPVDPDESTDTTPEEIPDTVVDDTTTSEELENEGN